MLKAMKAGCMNVGTTGVNTRLWRMYGIVVCGFVLASYASNSIALENRVELGLADKFAVLAG